MHNIEAITMSSRSFGIGSNFIFIQAGHFCLHDLTSTILSYYYDYCMGQINLKNWYNISYQTREKNQSHCSFTAML